MGIAIVGGHRHQGIAITMLLIRHVERAIVLRESRCQRYFCAYGSRNAFPGSYRAVEWLLGEILENGHDAKESTGVRALVLGSELSARKTPPNFERPFGTTTTPILKK